MDSCYHSVIQKNVHGRDFVIGDIHANKEMFLAALGSVNFDKTKDRLFCVGDLIDRGPQPLYILSVLINEPWFYSVLGNHEQMILDRFEFPMNKPIYTTTVKTQLDAIKLHRANGGDWFDGLSEDKQQSVYDLLKVLPHVIEIETDRGLVGLVHAEVPMFLDSWYELVVGLNEGDEKLKKEILWYRNVIHEFYDIRRDIHWEDEDIPVEKRWVKDIDVVVHGHTPVGKPAVYQNQVWIDTGYNTGKLTIMELNDLFNLVQGKA